MATQVALACVLLIGAALLGRSFRAMLHADRAYDASNVLTALVPLQSSRYTYAQRASITDSSSHQAAIAARRDRRRVRERPAALAGAPAARPDSTFARRPAATSTSQAALRIVSPGYLEALRQRVLEGRLFTDSDTASSQPVALVNRAFAHQYLDDRAIGVTLPIALAAKRDKPVVIGVVDDVRQRDLTGQAEPEVLLTFRQVENRPFDAALVVTDAAAIRWRSRPIFAAWRGASIRRSPSTR